MSFFPVSALLLVAATGPAANPTHARLAVAVVACKLAAVWSGAAAWIPSLLLPMDGRLCVLWFCLHPRPLAPPLAQPLLQRFGLCLFFLWATLAWAVLPAWLVDAGETCLLVLALVWGIACRAEIWYI